MYAFRFINKHLLATLVYLDLLLLSLQPPFRNRHLNLSCGGVTIFLLKPSIDVFWQPLITTFLYSAYPHGIL